MSPDLTAPAPLQIDQEIPLGAGRDRVGAQIGRAHAQAVAEGVEAVETLKVAKGRRRFDAPVRHILFYVYGAQQADHGAGIYQPR